MTKRAKRYSYRQSRGSSW